MGTPSLGQKYTWGTMIREYVQRGIKLQGSLADVSSGKTGGYRPQEGAEVNVKLIPVRNAVREEKRKKGDGEWDFLFY